ncbi:TetR/AcrR family transcriptional regulator C-terminal domain-containing protein [Streptomyces sp. NPDC059740]|uniref:TetR/AcrR family transcriptional regulator C-terminal domain-containing protein n=1 Tax=Streptomyces sp. NPDC059740 TaxID=3346926 RepID=UPI00365E5B4A
MASREGTGGMAARKRARGERAGLTRERVLDAALELVDRDGVEGLTMRRLGALLGVEAMTLYHYVPHKDALLDGVVERVFAPALPAVDGDTDWRTYLTGYAHALRAALAHHPGALPLAATRRAVTDATLDAVERGLSVLTAASFPLGRALDLLNTLSLLVIAHTAAEARHAAAAGEAEPRGAAPWIAAHDPVRYPLLTRAAATGEGTDDEARFRLAVASLLAGFAATLHEDGTGRG